MKKISQKMNALIMALASSALLVGCGGGGASSSSSSMSSSSSSNESSSSSSSSGSVSSSSSSEAIDMKKFPNYVKDLDSYKYAFTDKEMREPYWWGNIMSNESALMVDDGKTIGCTLSMSPKKIISVRDYTWTKEYKEGVDYTVSGNRLLWKEGSGIGYWNKEQLIGNGIPEPYKKVDTISNTLTDYVPWTGLSVYTESPFFYGTQIQVTYAYDVNDIDFASLPTTSVFDGLPNLKVKLAAKENVKMVTVGDSISEGCSSSFKFNHDPFMKPWVDQFSDELGKQFGVTVTSVNQSVGGKTSGYTSENDARLLDIANENPDVLFIHYGVNDLGNNETPSMYADNIEKIILTVQSSNPNCDIVLLSPISPNPLIYDTEKLGLYSKKLAKLAVDYTSSERGVAFVDVLKAAQSFAQNKQYVDGTANGINHPNDFGHRFYVMCLLSAFVDPTKL